MLRIDKDYYNLEYINEDVTISVKFSGDVNLSELRENLSSFLKAAGWCDFNIAKLFNEEIKND